MGLPFVIVKFGGSMLWAAMVYWIFAAVRPGTSAEGVALNATLFAVAVEFFKLYHAPLLDAFRRTLAGTLLLGHYFFVVGYRCLRRRHRPCGICRPATYSPGLAAFVTVSLSTGARPICSVIISLSGA